MAIQEKSSFLVLWAKQIQSRNERDERCLLRYFHAKVLVIVVKGIVF